MAAPTRRDRREERVREVLDLRAKEIREHAQQQGRPDPGAQAARQFVHDNWAKEQKRKGKETDA